MKSNFDSALRVESLFRGDLRRFAPLAVAESCTGGMAAAALTALPGASEWFGFGVVSYSNAAKMSVLRVPQSTLERQGAVSEETARAMCDGLKRLGAGAGLSITGIAGPGGGEPRKPVGTVCFGWFVGDEETTATEHFSGDRDSIRAQSVERAFVGLDNLAQAVLKKQ